MDQIQLNRVNMYQTVADYLESNNSIWNSMEPFSAANQSFQLKLLAIDQAARQQEAPDAAANSKAAARDALEDVLFLTCEALGVLAHTSNDHDLITLTNVSPTILDKLPADELINRATLVLERANARKTELAALHVSQANLDELSGALNTFSSLKNEPRAAAVERSAHTQSLESLIREANDILRNQLDRLVNLFRRTHPEFVAGYRSARVVVDRAATHRAKPAPPPGPGSAAERDQSAKPTI